MPGGAARLDPAAFADGRGLDLDERTGLTDILEVAREQVLERGVGLSEAQVLDVLRLPDDRLAELLELAHEVRMRWCGPEVEVEGIVSLKTGGCPEDCHFCSQSGLFPSPVRAAWLDIPSLVKAAARPRPPARRSSASSRPCAVPTSG